MIQIFGPFIAIFYLVFRSFIPNKPGSHPFSRLFRKLFELPQTKTYWSIGLMAIILTINLFYNNQSYHLKPAHLALAAPENVITTETTYQLPVLGVLSQGYHWYHQAIDLATPNNQEVYPIADGEVVAVKSQFLGYGNYLVINHANNIKSLYAHFNEIRVLEGQKITKNTLLGHIGLTGFTSGLHLHLEIYDHSKPINPLEILPDMPLVFALK